MAAPSLLLIGHLCHDRMPSGEIKLGGTAAYAAILARRMKVAVTILTSVGSDFAFFEIFDQHNISIINIPTEETTVFENIYPEKGERTQFLHARGATLSPKNLPSDLPDFDMVLFCPIADEVDLALLTAFPDTLKMATIQGWLRAWNLDGKVFPKVMRWDLLAPLDLLVFSDADMLGFENFIPEISTIVSLVIMTRGKNGVRTFQNGTVRNFSTIPVEVRDATGAGDSFAVAFLLTYFRTGDLEKAVACGQDMAREMITGKKIFR